MNTRRKVSLCMGLLITVSGWAQIDWNLGGNNVINGADYLGCDATSTEPLHLRTIPDLAIDMSTSDIHRFRLLPDATYVVNPGLPAKTADGWALLCPDVAGFYSNGAPGPFSLLHLSDGLTNVMTSDRAWMNIGITFTGNRDMGYIGQKAYGVDRTDMVFHWSDDPGEAAADRARFLFTSGFNASAPTGATSAEGLEGMRLFAVDNDNINVGIGDWFAANFNDPTITEPDERLDIVDGNVRIRALPGTSAANTENRYMVVDANGVVRWRDLPAGAGCEWNLVGNNPVTAYAGNPCPPRSDKPCGHRHEQPASEIASIGHRQ